MSIFSHMELIGQTETDNNRFVGPITNQLK